jgi:hypothetical protein
VRAQREKPAVLVERKLSLADVVAVMIVGCHGFAALANPFDRTAQFARRPQHKRIFWKVAALHAEASAHLARDDA